MATDNTSIATLPAWAQELLGKYENGTTHAFLLHGNVADYVERRIPLNNYVDARLLGARRIIAHYDRASGITFPVVSMEEEAKLRLGLGGAGGGASDALAALREVDGAGSDWPKQPGAALAMLERLLRTGSSRGGETVGDVAIVIDYAESLLPNADWSAMSPDDRTNIVTVERWGRDPQLTALANPIILIARNLTDIHQMIRAASSKFESIELPLPGVAQRAAFVDLLGAESPALFDGEVSRTTLTNSTAGLALMHVYDIVLRAEQNGALTYNLITERKGDIIKSEYNEILAVYEPQFGYEAVGGHEVIKQYFRDNVIGPMQEQDVDRVPQGVLLVGPAGTGKTIFAKATAREAGVNFIILDIGKLMGGIVGESERKTEQAVRAIESLAPTIVFIDELDQALQRNSGGGDSGVQARMFQKLMQVMSNTRNRGKVLFMAASNRPDMIDSAMRRAGRFDIKVPFLVPDAAERRAILEALAKQRAAVGLQVSDAVLQATEGWTGAELEGLVGKAFQLVTGAQRIAPADALTQAGRRLRKSTADVKFMTDLALLEVNDLDLLPERYWGMLDRRDDVEARVAQAPQTQEVQRRKRDM